MESEAEGMDYVAKTEQEKQAVAAKQRETVTDIADLLKGRPWDYMSNMAEWAMWLLMHIEWTIGWDYHCIPTKSGNKNIYGKNFATKDGILFVLKAPNGKVFVRAMSCCFDAPIDINAVTTFVVQAENTLDQYNRVLETESIKKFDETIKPYLK
jgi:hypothetical protein